MGKQNGSYARLYGESLPVRIPFGKDYELDRSETVVPKSLLSFIERGLWRNTGAELLDRFCGLSEGCRADPYFGDIVSESSWP